MIGMKDFLDGYFDLAIVDPPYGSANNDEWDTKERGRYKIERTGGTWSKKYQENNNIKTWDFAPDKEYFDELFRVSKNQIIWGANYFNEYIPNHRCFIIWKKLTISEKFTMAMCEYAYCSLNENAKIFECAPQDAYRFHPTQKPIALYKWLCKNFCKPGYKILDTHAGSCSSLIAYEEMGLDYVAYEIDPEYYKLACERINKYREQLKLFPKTFET